MDMDMSGVGAAEKRQQLVGEAIDALAAPGMGEIPGLGQPLPAVLANPLASPLGVIGSSPMQSQGWTHGYSPQQLAAQQVKMANPSPKRAYGQVQRVAEDQWRCPDGKTFPRAYLAYRHLKELKEKNPNLLSPYKSPRTTTAERRAMQQRVVASAAYSAGASPMLSESMDPSLQPDVKRTVVELYSSQLDAEKLDQGRSGLYAVARTWRLNDPYGLHGAPKRPEAPTGNGIDLPAPLPHTAESQATDYREGKTETVVDLATVINAAPDTPTELLLATHQTFAKAIRNWWQTRRVHRINRYRKARLDVILPGFAAGAAAKAEVMMEEEDV